MPVLEPGMRYVDLNFQNVPSVIATAVLEGPDGVALVDPGPTSALETLRARLAEAGIGMKDVTSVLLTHIHLDHAGASGTIVAERPDIRVHVHERGAPHMIDPRKLLESATRLYGGDMDRLWGAFLPVPAGNVSVLRGGERVDAGGRSLEVAYTPGHASHHVSYFDRASGIAFVGDTGGVRIGSSTALVAPTPPPDIDLDTWKASLDRILEWRPSRLFMTHFGPGAEPDAQLAELVERLHRSAEVARVVLEAGGTDAEASARFERDMREELRRHMTEAELASYELAVPLAHCFMGLARYWRKRA